MQPRSAASRPSSFAANGILVQFVALEYGREISFAEWLMIGGPVALAFLPLAWLLITRVLYPIRLPEIAGGKALFEREYRELGPMNRGERITLAVLRSPRPPGYATAPGRPRGGPAPGSRSRPFRRRHRDRRGARAVPAARERPRCPAVGRARIGGGKVMDWETAERLRGVLILFGGA